MAVSYNKLWKLLIDKGINKTKLRNATNVSSSTMAKLTKNQPVAMPVLEKICAELECNIEDIMEFNKLDEVKLKMQQKGTPPDESIQ
jgi:DNA-binding Xre family transcriptional regulator